MIAIGCCLVGEPEIAFYRELQPLPESAWDANAERIHLLTREHLAAHGSTPEAAIVDLVSWVGSASGDRTPVFVGFNAPFDWMFVADYCHRFGGRNPFGISALDIKSLYMGHAGVQSWRETRKNDILERYPTRARSTHNALDDARAQAELAALILAEIRPRPSAPPGC